MKRTLLGLFVMGSLVGLGSVGVYFAQGKLAHTAPAAETEFQDIPDRTPKPIPVAKSDDSEPVAPSESGSPFISDSAPSTGAAATPYDDATQDVAAADRYQTYRSDDGADYSDDIPDAAPLPTADGAPATGDRYAEYDVQPTSAVEESTGAGDIPDAAPIAAVPSASPFEAQGDEPLQQTAAGSRYAEPSSAAEVPVEAAAGAAADRFADVPGDEPRRLQAADAQPSTDRYASPADGNPLRAGGNSQYGQPENSHGNPPVQGPAATDSYPTDSYPGEVAPSAAPLAGGAMSFDPPQGAEGTGRPGDPQLNGQQAPALTIEKAAPPEIQIGKPAKFIVKVKNVGTATAHGVEVHDMVPQGTQLIDTAPPSNRGAGGELVWEIGSLEPGEERTVEMQLMPTAEGEIGSVATVRFHARASVRTLATKPMLSIEVLGPSKVMKGQQLTLRIKLSNPGSGATAGVMLSETVPQGLSHAAGKELEFEVGTLKPGESRELDLTLTAAEAGMVTNVISADAEAKLHAEAHTEIEIVAPLLQVSMTGPKRRYLERNASHNISVTNPGTAPAKNIDLVAVLPRTLKFVEANNGGQFDEATHAVYWNLEELPPQETGTVKLTTLPLEAGEARLVIKSSSQGGLKDEREEVVSIEGLAAINFQLSDVKDPIEVGAETAYEIRVTNQGTKAATNVSLAALLPRGMKPVSAEGPVRYQVEGQRVLFEPLRALAPKADTLFTIKVQAVEPGDQRIEVQVATDEIRDPISKEESTRVYGNE